MIKKESILKFWSKKEEKKVILSPLKSVISNNIPEHIAIIMDGNGRWAKKQLKERAFGHKMGAENLRNIVRYASQIGIKVLTVYAFSTENWQRPKKEVSLLMKLFEHYLDHEISELNQNNVQLRVIGELEKLSDFLQKKIKQATLKTKENSGLKLVLAVNYGSRREIINAVRNITFQVEQKKININDIEETLITEYLTTFDLPDVDLLIRTGGDKRVSNFLLWQIAYAEFWFTEKNWPEFTEKDLQAAIDDFQKRERRFGGLKET